MVFDPNANKNIAKVAEQALDRDISTFNAKLRDVADNKRDKPTDEVLPVLQQVVDSQSFVSLNQEAVNEMAGWISKGSIPVFDKKSKTIIEVTRSE